MCKNTGKLDKETLRKIVHENYREQYETSMFFNRVIDYLTLETEDIGEKEVVRCLSELSRSADRVR